MLGGGLKKLAGEYALTVEQGIAYGEIEGYTLTLFESAETKTLGIAAFFEAPGEAEQFAAVIEARKKDFAIQKTLPSGAGLQVVFLGGIGAVKKIKAFLEWLPGQLRQYGARGTEECAFCHGPLAGDSLYIRYQDIACRVHSACLDGRQAEFRAMDMEAAGESKHMLRGALGALVGGLLGTVPWIVAYYFGWFVGWLGFLIGIAANKGFSLFGGKPGKAKLYIVAAVVIFCVLFSFVAGAAVELTVMVIKGEAMFALGDIPRVIGLIFSDAEFVQSLVPDVFMGLLFAGLGCWSILGELKKEGKGASASIVRLDARRV